MGDFAQDNLDYNADTELAYLDYIEGNLSREEAFDLGIIDSFGFHKDLPVKAPPPYDVQGMELYSQQLINIFHNDTPPKSSSLKFLQRKDNNAIIALLNKVEKRYSMLLGMSYYPIKGKSFSNKQEKWLSTNWKGGYQQFEIDLKKDYMTIQQQLKKILLRVDQIKKEYVT
jgi:hypothetical protein